MAEVGYATAHRPLPFARSQRRTFGGRQLIARSHAAEARKGKRPSMARILPRKHQTLWPSPLTGGRRDGLLENVESCKCSPGTSAGRANRQRGGPWSNCALGTAQFIAQVEIIATARLCPDAEPDPSPEACTGPSSLSDERPEARTRRARTHRPHQTRSTSPPGAGYGGSSW
jgi:hypothetical protein